jgi:GNAT superfamily N-acetyltransferase
MPRSGGAGIAVRRARASDAAALGSLSEQLGYPASAAQIRRRLAPISRSKRHAVFVAVSAGAELLGWVHVFGALRLETGPFAELGGLVVSQTHRGRGVGRLLVETASAWAARRGFRRIRVRCNVLREEAHPFYRRIGFEEDKRQAVFSRSLRRGSPRRS